MILGELCNFAGPLTFFLPKSFGRLDFQLTVAIAYAFVEAIVVVSPISPAPFPAAVPVASITGH